MKKHSNREAYEKKRASESTETATPVKSQTAPTPQTTTTTQRKTEAPKKSTHTTAPQGKTAPKSNGKYGKVILLSAILVIAAILIFALLYSAFGGKGDFTASFTVNSSTATLGNQTITMDAPTLEISDTTMIPIVDAAEVLPITVKWKEDDTKATIKGNGVKIKLTVDDTAVEINGESSTWKTAPLLDDNTLYVPLAPLCEALGYGTAYISSIEKINIFNSSKDNNPPTADFTTDKDTYAIGEAVTYDVTAEDPDDDAIADYKWSNHQDTFDTAGTFTITLSVMDARGAWSDEVSKTITITEAADTEEEAATE